MDIGTLSSTFSEAYEELLKAGRNTNSQYSLAVWLSTKYM